MEHDTEIKAASSDLRLFQGLIENEGRSYSNWGLHRTTTPAVFAKRSLMPTSRPLCATPRAFQRPSIRSAR